MVGTLTVQNLQGPTSGANANKVIVPSGQTLDASGGTLVPSAGAVVQTVKWNPVVSTTTSVANTVWVDLATTSMSFTQNNLVHATGQMAARNNNTSGWTLNYLALYVDDIGFIYKSGYNGTEGTRFIGSLGLDCSFIWSVSGTKTVRIKGASYNATSSSFGNHDQDSNKTQNEFFTFMEIKQ
jgi:hypothetical protein